MGRIDDAALAFFSVPERFADVMNFRFFDGKNVIKPEELHAADSVMAGRQRRRSGDTQGRVIVDKTMLWRDRYLRILIQEYQAFIDYGMLFRSMFSEALAYHRQYKDRQREHKRMRDLKTGDEFLSGIKRDDRFAPVITLVINLSGRRWNGEKSLYGMLNEGADDIIKPWISEYRLNVLDYHDYESLDAFSTDVKKVFEILSCMEDRSEIISLLEQDKSYADLEDDMADLIEAISDVRISHDDGGKRDMCEAWIDQKEAGRVEGRVESIMELLQDYGKVTSDLRKRISEENDLDTLSRWHKLAARSGSIEAFVQAM